MLNLLVQCFQMFLIKFPDDTPHVVIGIFFDGGCSSPPAFAEVVEIKTISLSSKTNRIVMKLCLQDETEKSIMVL